MAWLPVSRRAEEYRSSDTIKVIYILGELHYTQKVLGWKTDLKSVPYFLWIQLRPLNYIEGK
jgi:hypothetical protein